MYRKLSQSSNALENQQNYRNKWSTAKQCIYQVDVQQSVLSVTLLHLPIQKTNVDTDKHHTIDIFYLDLYKLQNDLDKFHIQHQNLHQYNQFYAEPIVPQKIHEISRKFGRHHYQVDIDAPIQ